jgi:hypothetical protein
MTTYLDKGGERGACERCFFWDSANGQVGYCKRRSPSVSPQGSPAWPMTGYRMWCGEFSTPQPNVDEGDGE